MNIIAAIWVILGFISAIIIALDLISHKQSMKIMNPVWVLTGLWASILGLIVYFWFGREKNGGKMEKMDMGKMNMQKMDMGKSMQNMPDMKMNNMADMAMDDNMAMTNNRTHWKSITISTLHCGAGCTLADIIGEWFLYFAAISIGGSLILGSVVIDYILALIIGIYFQYQAIKNMNSNMAVKKVIVKAIKADILSLTAWQIGMYGFMAIALFIIFPYQTLSKTSWLFWFMMQIAMIAGFAVAFPVNILLIKYGIKKSM